MKRRLLIMGFSIAAITFALFGCGYHFNLSGSSLRGGLHSLAIPTLDSRATVQGLEADFTNIIRKEFSSHSTIALVTVKDASAVLVGRIERIETSPLSYDIQESSVGGKTVSYELTNLRRIKVKLSMKMVRRDTGEILWEEKGMEEKASYSASNDPIETSYREKIALRQIAEQLAKRVYLKTVDTF
ncbi:MAG TPA: hypothetical protein ENG73_05915 [Desulfobacterales bacterium]|nr:hypothetical protein [Desulfobacterales bacterium]